MTALEERVAASPEFAKSLQWLEIGEPEDGDVDVGGKAVLDDD